MSPIRKDPAKQFAGGKEMGGSHGRNFRQGKTKRIYAHGAGENRNLQDAFFMKIAFVRKAFTPYRGADRSLSQLT
jgi:hypothetical protein